jgi:Glycosyltransferase family 87
MLRSDVAAQPAWSPSKRAVRRWAGDERVLLALYGGLAAVFALQATKASHQVWDRFAVPGYVLGVLIALLVPNRGWASCLTALTTVVLPTVYLSGTTAARPEVQVVVDGAEALLRSGSPYLSHPQGLYDLRPYLPAIFVFGLPTALASGWFLDPRVLALMLLAVCGWGAGRLARGCAEDAPERWRVRKNFCLTISCPLAAQAISTSFIDVPQSALTLLAVAAMARGRGVFAGIAVGATLAMKPTALVSLFVLVVFARARHGTRTGVQVALSAALTAILLAAPFLYGGAERLWRNAVLFPLGTYGPESPAQTPFPGVLLRQAGTPASVLVGLTAVVAVSYACLCIRHVNGAATRAAGLLAGGLTLAFMTAPYSRVGYLVVPLLVYFGTRAVFGPGTGPPAGASPAGAVPTRRDRTTRGSEGS